jgi:hypothetical protein
MKKKIRDFSNFMGCLFTGMVFGSLLITEDNAWKFALPMCLICIMVSNVLRED